MHRLILALAVIGALWYAASYYRSRPPEQRRRLIWTWSVGALIGITILLAVTGRIHWVGAVIAAAIPVVKFCGLFLWRTFPLLRRWFGRAKPSKIKTRGLEVTIDLASGNIDGEVLTGPREGRQLSDLTSDELREQLAYFQKNDRQSALLLRTYMVRRGFSESVGSGQETGGISTNMTRDEAWQVLGLEPGAPREDIILAHKRLIQKLHPDRGGNDYLAAKINAAKDTLIA